MIKFFALAGDDVRQIKGNGAAFNRVFVPVKKMLKLGFAVYAFGTRVGKLKIDGMGLFGRAAFLIVDGAPAFEFDCFAVVFVVSVLPVEVFVYVFVLFRRHGSP